MKQRQQLFVAATAVAAIAMAVLIAPAHMHLQQQQKQQQQQRQLDSQHNLKASLSSPVLVDTQQFVAWQCQEEKNELSNNNKNSNYTSSNDFDCHQFTQRNLQQENRLMNHAPGGVEQDSALFCIVHHNSTLITTELSHHPTILSVFDSFDWKFAIVIGVLLACCKWFQIGVKPQRQYLNFLLYLMGVACWRCFLPSYQGLFVESVFTTVRRSAQAFVAVHPIETSSYWIGLCHLGTYWFEIAAFRAKNLQSMLFWCFLFEMVTGAVNESAHAHWEADSLVRCLRASFMDHMHQYPISDVIREYVMPGFMVYGYWFPRFLLYKVMGG